MSQKLLSAVLKIRLGNNETHTVDFNFLHKILIFLYKNHTELFTCVMHNNNIKGPNSSDSFTVRYYLGMVFDEFITDDPNIVDMSATLEGNQINCTASFLSDFRGLLLDDPSKAKSAWRFGIDL